MNYCSLHCHTARGSNLRLLDSIVRIPKLVERAIEYGYNGVCITDHEVLGAHLSALKYRDEIQKTHPDFKIMLGNEIYLIDETEYKNPVKFFHFILIAKDKEGYQQLKTLSARAWKRSYKKGQMYRSPTFYQDITEIVGANPGHLFASSACIGGEIGYCILNKDQARLNRFVSWCIDTFGKDNFFLEMQDSDSEEQQAVNNTILRMADHFGLKYIVTSDVHYVDGDQKDIHSAFLNSHEESERETEQFYRYCYLKPRDEMSRIMSYLPQSVIDTAMENTQIIYNAVENFDIRHSTVIPEVKIHDQNFQIDPILADCPKEHIQQFVHSPHIQDRYWAYQIAKGIKEKFNPAVDDMEVWLDRIDQEMEIIWGISEYHQQRMGAYYTLVQRIVNIIWQVSIVGCGRGSAPGFFTNYLLGITQFNPLTYDLPHWRHINLSRLSDFPDVDVDCDSTKSDEILALLREEFGEDCVLNTLTFHTESLKSAILTAMRGKGCSSDEAQALSSMVPIERGKVASLAECLGEVEGVDPVPGFKEALERYGVLDIVREIEGLESGAGVHASSVYIFNDGYLSLNGMMLSASGAPITCFDMHDSDDCGALKFDLLKIDAATKMMKCLQLLLNAGQIQWQGTLRETYNKYLHPDIIDFNDPKIWDAVDAGKITDLFQMITAVGGVAIKKVQPRSILELSLCNDGMRLMGTLNGLTPVERLAAFKQNPQLWYDEMKGKGLTAEEVHTLEPYLAPTYGNSINQETLMRILMCPKISNFTLGEANNARKVLAKKLTHKVAELKEEYFRKGKEAGQRETFLQYVYTYFLEPQLGYSFSTIHSHAYSIIGIQEAYLYTHYNPLFWNCACLSVNSGSADTDFEDFGDEEEEEEIEIEDQVEGVKKKVVVTNYGKISKALGDIRSRGIDIELPEINRAMSDFTPDIERNAILYGMQAIAGLNPEALDKIISGRPYTSLDDFMNRVELTNLQMIALIKAGAFDEVERHVRTFTMDKYLKAYAARKITKKPSLTMANYAKAQELGIIPSQYAMQVKMIYFKKWIDTHSVELDAAGKKRYVLTDPDEQKFFSKIVMDSLAVEKDYSVTPKGFIVKTNSLKKVYEAYIQPLKEWMLTPEAAESFYQAEMQKMIDEQYNKYCQGTVSKWEMDSMSYYYGPHELARINTSKYGIVDFNSLSEMPVASSYKTNPKTGVEFPVYENVRIAGTVLNANKAKHIVTLLTPTGVVDVKFYKFAFITFNKRISKMLPDGKKQVLEGSWFTRGNKLLVSGIRKENMFIPRRDYSKGFDGLSVRLITGVTGSDLILKNERERGD